MRHRPKRSSPDAIQGTPANHAVATIAIFVVALLIRLIAAWQLGSLPLSRTPQLDSAAYLTWARAIVAGDGAWPAYPEHSPGYPFFAAAILAATGGSVMAVRVGQSLLGAVACVLTARIASRTVAPRAYLWAGLIQALYAPLVYIETAVLAEAVLVFLLVLTLDIVTAAENRGARWLPAGIALGAAAVVRPTALALVPAFLIVVATKHRRATAMRLAAAFIAGSLVFTAPVVIQNWRVTGVPMIQAYGGMNFYLGNRPAGDGGARARLGGEWDALEGEASRAGVTRNDQDTYYLRRTGREILDRPTAYAGVLVSKLFWTLQDDELRDTHSFYFFAEAWPPLRWLPSFGVVLALAVAGLIAAKPRDPAWLIAYGVAMLATTVFLVIGTRYRIPLVSVVIAVAGGGLASLANAIRSQRWSAAPPLLAVTLLAWAATEIRHDAVSHNLAEEHVMTGLSLLQEGHIEDAEAACRAAIAADANSSFAWDVLGLVLQRRQLRNDAHSAFQRAVQINPRNATAWSHLGFSEELAGNPANALNAYRQALAIVPARGDILEMYDAARRRYR